MHLGGFGSNGKWGLAVLALALVATSCTTTAEHRKLFFSADEVAANFEGKELLEEEETCDDSCQYANDKSCDRWRC